MARLVVATYNVHGGVDGWGRPFDVVDACRRIDADVLVLQESWAPDGRPSLAATVADALGYVASELVLARGRILVPPADMGRRWGPHVWARSSFGLRIVRRRPRRVDRPRVTARHDMELGTWGIAVLCRLPIRRTWTIELPQLHGDAARRGAVVVEVLLQGVDHAVPVVGTHLAHIRQGSPRHIAVLRRRLRAEGLGRVAARHGGGADERAGEGAGRGVLAGDMNMWGPPLVALLPGWSRVVRGRTWPTWLPRPVAQSDHVLVSGGIEGTGSVLRVGGSDHLPVRAELVI